jgi:hypothetical protein
VFYLTAGKYSLTSLLLFLVVSGESEPDHLGWFKLVRVLFDHTENTKDTFKFLINQPLILKKQKIK